MSVGSGTEDARRGNLGRGAVVDIFRALGDPFRLEMVRRLTEGPPLTIATVSDGLGISRQGARKHLQVLADAELVSMATKGREVLVELSPPAMDRAKAFLAEMERRWDVRLEALRRLVEEA